MDEPAPERCQELERALETVEEETARLLSGKISSREPLAPAERDVLSTFFALLGIRLSPGFAELEESEARRGCDELVLVLRAMGWVFCEAEPPGYFISSNAPFHVAFPGNGSLVQGMGLHAPGVEITLPLTPRLALYASWKRRGEIWRRAGG